MQSLARGSGGMLPTLENFEILVQFGGIWSICFGIFETRYNFLMQSISEHILIL